MDKKMEKWRIAVAFLMAAAMIGQSLWADGGTAFAAGYQEVMEPNSSKTVETVGQEAVEPKNGRTVGTVGQEAVEPKNGKTVGTVGQEAVEPKNSKTVGTVGQEALGSKNSKTVGTVGQKVLEPCGNGLAPEEQGFARSAARTASSMRAAKSTRTTALKLGKEEQENLEEGWSWKKDSDSPLSYTLTLDHVDFEVPGDSAISLYADSGFPIQNMNIALSGENRLISTNQTENAYNGCGIYLDSYGAQIKPAVLISGTGSLTVKGNSRGAVIQGSLSISGVSMDDQSEGSNGVVVSKSLNMENSALKSNYLSAEFLSMRNSSLSLFRAGASPQGKGLARIGSCDIEGSNLELSGAEGVDAPYAAISSNGETVLIRNSSVAIRNVERGIEISTADSSSICLDHVTGTLFCSKTSQYLNKGNPAFYADQVEVSDSTLYVQTGDHIYAYGGCALPEEIKDVAVSGNLSIEEGKSFTVGKGQNMHFTANYATIEGGEGASFINNGTVEFSYSPNIKTSFVNNGRLDSGNGIDCSHQQFTNNGTFHGMVKEGSGTIHYYYGEAVHNFNRILGGSGRWISKAFLMPGAALIIPAGKYLDATKNGITWDNLDSYLSMGEGSRIIVEEGAELRLPPNDTGNKFPSLRVSGNGIVKIGDHALFRLECWDGETLLSTGFVKEDNTVTEPDAPIKEGCTF